jgi:spermidine synthase
MVVECRGCCWVVAEALQLFQAEFQQANVRTLRVGGVMNLAAGSLSFSDAI